MMLQITVIFGHKTSHGGDKFVTEGNLHVTEGTFFKTENADVSQMFLATKHQNDERDMTRKERKEVIV